MRHSADPVPSANRRAGHALSLLGTALRQVLADGRDQFLREVVNAPPPRPWMKHREIDLITEILIHLRPLRALEWGAGYSTLYFSRHLTPGARWTAVEHDPSWAAEIGARNRRPNVEIVHVPPDPLPATGEQADPGDASLRAYVDFADRLAPLDFVLVDGRARPDCVRKAYSLLHPMGVVVLHDANRPYDPKPFRLYAHQALFRDHRVKAGGVWVGSREMDLARVIDLERQRRLWRGYTAVGRRIRL